MRVTLDAARVKALARRTGAVVKTKGAAHPALELVVFDLSEWPATVRAANAGAIYVNELVCAHVDPDAGGTNTHWAIRQEHLTALAGLAPSAAQFVLDASAGELTATITTGDETIGSWTLPLAGRRELDAFPDEPEMLTATTQGLSFDAAELIEALAHIAPFATDHGTLQVTNGTIAAATWAGAARSAIETGPTEGMIALPGAAAPILSRLATDNQSDRVRVSETEGWYHLVQRPLHRLHLAKLTAAVDAIMPTYFGPALHRAAQVDVTGSALARAVERASALTDHVRLEVQAGTLVVAAADGSSEQTVAASFVGDEVVMTDGWVFPTSTLLPVLRLLDVPATVGLTLPTGPQALAYLASYALVPVADPTEG